LRPEIETLTVTLCVAPAFRVLPAGLIVSQLEPLAVDADHEPAEPQFVNLAVCAAGSPCPCVPVNISVPGLAWIHGGGGCTVNETDTLCCIVPELAVMEKVIVSV